MTFLEKRMAQFTDLTEEKLASNYCPSEFDYEDFKDAPCFGKNNQSYEVCERCWDREIPGTEVEQMELDDFTADDDDLTRGIEAGLKKADEITNMINECKKILDSGERRQFETGAVRDIQEGKGRMDLAPLNVIGGILEDGILMDIYMFQDTDDTMYLAEAIKNFSRNHYENLYTMFIEVSKHFEEGAKKYGESNWRRGIPTKHYIDSAVRHYMKFCRGDNDEYHDRAFIWNLLCCIWTVVSKPELDSYRRD